MTELQDRDQGGGANARLTLQMQDELVTADTELERLERLLADAVGQLAGHFGRARGLCVDGTRGETGALAGELESAMVALQFQDMASQLIAHARRRIAAVADGLAQQIDGTEPGYAPQWVERPCPVAQRAIDAGSVELF